MTVKRIQSKIQKQIESYIHVKVHTTYNCKRQITKFSPENKIVSSDISWLEVKRIWHIWHIKKQSQEYTTRKKTKEGEVGRVEVDWELPLFTKNQNSECACA